ncbi:uncharacterized protein EV420DRAFT_738193 [Desarmillaria tabescens]|uniref:Uncharacterized protein n=1 Tax=Armillaria tabescens TaxID=1929756 RepID=A0AA39JZA4_ARMTA|nr:uncharacterized protein EV420DRAFT_738193 [Desarmillaria tabescens]KAK0450525.1 hypothetical protein EV420DRAFT_738193 [Desarmillaria tabescens]
MAVHLGVALHYVQNDIVNPHPYFHWVLVATEAMSWLSPFSPTHTFEIIRNTDTKRRWETRFRASNLGNSTSLAGIVEFAQTDLDMDSIRRVIETHPAMDEGWRIQGPTGWSCATWVLHVMLTLEEMAIFDLPENLTPDMLYDSILGEGYRIIMGKLPSKPTPVVQLSAHSL